MPTPTPHRHDPWQPLTAKGDRRCQAAQASGAQCRQKAVEGGDKCRYHRGGNGTHRRKYPMEPPRTEIQVALEERRKRFDSLAEIRVEPARALSEAHALLQERIDNTFDEEQLTADWKRLHPEVLVEPTAKELLALRDLKLRTLIEQSRLMAESAARVERHNELLETMALKFDPVLVEYGMRLRDALLEEVKDRVVIDRILERMRQAEELARAKAAEVLEREDQK